MPFTQSYIYVIVSANMSELLQFPLQGKGKHRRSRDTSARHKIMRAAGVGLFTIGAYVGIKHGVDAITENHPEQQLVAHESDGRITPEQTHAAVRDAITETVHDMTDVMYSIGGLTVAIGTAVVSMAVTASRNERYEVGPALIPPDLAIAE